MYEIHYIFFVESISNVMDIVQDCLDGMDLVVKMEETLCQKQLYSHSSKESGILSVEHNLLQVGSNPAVTQAVFYMLPIIHKEKVFIRYFRICI